MKDVFSGKVQNENEVLAPAVKQVLLGIESIPGRTFVADWSKACLLVADVTASDLLTHSARFRNPGGVETALSPFYERRKTLTSAHGLKLLQVLMIHRLLVFLASEENVTFADRAAGGIDNFVAGVSRAFQLGERGQQVFKVLRNHYSTDPSRSYSWLYQTLCEYVLDLRQPPTDAAAMDYCVGVIANHGASFGKALDSQMK